jgi:hypothetical protein
MPDFLVHDKCDWFMGPYRGTSVHQMDPALHVCTANWDLMDNTPDIWLGLRVCCGYVDWMQIRVYRGLESDAFSVSFRMPAVQWPRSRSTLGAR